MNPIIGNSKRRYGRHIATAAILSAALAFGAPGAEAASPPTTTIAAPAFTSQSPGPTFEVTVTAAAGDHVRIKCDLDANTWTYCDWSILQDLNSCTSNGLTESCFVRLGFISPLPGPHTFSVYSSACTSACENESNWTAGAAAHHPFVVDWTAPQITLTGPTSTNAALSHNVTFSFTSDEPTLPFSCRIDQGPAAPCTSPVNYPNLANGSHEFQVWQDDAAHNEGIVIDTFDVDVFKPKACGKKSRNRKKAAKRAKCVRANALAKAKWKRKHHIK